MKSKILSIIIILFINTFVSSQDKSELYNFLQTIPGIKIESIKADTSLFTEAYKIMVIQPLDHFNEGSKTFTQRIYLSHNDKEEPMVLSTEGYAAPNYTLELSKLLNCNQIIVEHRYFGQSVPDSVDWKYLTIEEAAADHHKIVEMFKNFYSGKWISTGISKGGQTIMYHSYFYPEDVDVSIPYVAPLNFSTSDERVYDFLNNVSTPECREKVKDFQKLVLEKRDEIFPMYTDYVEENEIEYSISLNEAYEYTVLEYSFAYWQWSNGKCEEIPDEKSTNEEIFNHLRIYSPFDYFSTEGIKAFEPFFYQAFTQIGYYEYKIDEFGDLIKYVDGSNKVFYPENVELNYDPEIMQKVNHFIQNKADNFIFIYGGNDPWSSTSVELTGKTNSIKMVLEGGSHRTRIKHFKGEQKEKIISTLENWLDMEIDESRI